LLHPSLARPNHRVTASFPNDSLATVEFLKIQDFIDGSNSCGKLDARIKAIIFDKDNTLTLPYANKLAPQAVKIVQECQKIFGSHHALKTSSQLLTVFFLHTFFSGRDRVLVVSNSVGSADDPAGDLASRLEATLDMHVLVHKTRKPLGGEEALRAFPGLSPNEVPLLSMLVLCLD